MRLDLGDDNVMMGADLVKKTTDVLNKSLVVARLDGVVPKEVHAILTVGDQVEAAGNRLRRNPVRDTNPLEGVIKCADFTGVVGRKEKAPIQSGSDRSVTTGPQNETGWAEAQVRYIPHPAVPDASEAEPSV